MATAVLPACPFSTCVTPGISHYTHPEGEPCIHYIYKCVFLALRHFFSSGRGSCLVLSAPWHAGSPPGHWVQAWALAVVRGTCSGGSKWHVPSGRDSEHVEPSRCMQTQEQVERMSDDSCDIWDLECHQCRQTLLTSRWKRFSPTPTCQTCDHC